MQEREELVAWTERLDHAEDVSRTLSNVFVVVPARLSRRRLQRLALFSLELDRPLVETDNQLSFGKRLRQAHSLDAVPGVAGRRFCADSS